MHTPYQPNNPTDMARHQLLIYALQERGHPEDFLNIIQLLSPPPDITTIAQPGSFKAIKVGVIGGGLAGLCAAFELRKLGFDITIFEAEEERIGGRVYTYYFDRDKKYYGELGAMRIPVSHEVVWHYINLFHLNTRPFIQTNENAFIYVKNRRARNDPEGREVRQRIYPCFNLTPWERSQPWFNLFYYGLERPLLSMAPSVRRELLEVRRHYPPQIIYWDSLNLRQTMQQAGLSQGAIHLISSLDPLIGQYLYSGYINILEEVYPEVFSFLYEIVGGMVRLPLALYTSLLSPNPTQGYSSISTQHLGRVTWKGGHWVTAIRQDGKQGSITLQYKNKISSQSLYASFDYIVCAIPFSTLRTIDIQPLFSNGKMQAIRELNYETAQKTAFLSHERFWEKGGPKESIIGGGSFTDLPISSIWYPSDHGEWVPRENRNSYYCYTYSPSYQWHMKKNCTPLEPGVFLASYNFNLDAIRLGNMEEEERFIEIKRQVEAVHGLPLKFLDPIIRDFKTVHWNREPWFRGAFSIWNPEQKRLFSYAMNTPEYDHRVFFAGEHVSPHHAWMQGALQSGMEAANGIARACLSKK